jgi:hypothetical protein
MGKIFPHKELYVALALSGFFIGSCDSGGLTGRLSGSDNPASRTVLEPEIFSEAPIDLRGCACFFARDSQSLISRRFVFANDMDKISVIKINGAFVPMYKSESRNINDFDVEEIYTSGEYKLILTIHDEGSVDPSSSRKSGKLQLILPQGRSRVISFVGRCGF